MAGTIKPMLVVLIAVVSIMSVVPKGEAAIGCGTVVSYLNPCLPYVTGNGCSDFVEEEIYISITSACPYVLS
ncbi:UNVERIFIED_CONTAM: hypothetical protein Scaly_0827800 [Sesamum calycinum]|uniref:Uncharacterized protein n=1 Tax=Sesamum calycinum TaxID=2727403 RepID=A0AAW2RAA3_9LAMI